VAESRKLPGWAVAVTPDGSVRIRRSKRWWVTDSLFGISLGLVFPLFAWFLDPSQPLVLVPYPFSDRTVEGVCILFSWLWVGWRRAFPPSEWDCSPDRMVERRTVLGLPRTRVYENGSFSVYTFRRFAQGATYTYWWLVFEGESGGRRWRRRLTEEVDAASALAQGQFFARVTGWRVREGGDLGLGCRGARILLSDFTI
jgi:hypothetical protein